MSRMSQPPSSIALDEQAGRRVVLAQAIETSDPQVGLLSAEERVRLNRLALETATAAGSATSDMQALAAGSFLEAHARQVLRIVENRNPALASLQAPRLPVRWMAAGFFLAAAALGAATDRIANPHRIDLLSLPLLAILVWNAVVYAALVSSFFLHRFQHRERGADNRGTATPLSRWIDDLRGRAGHTSTGAAAVFLRNWRRMTAALNARRFAKLLHLAAAGWALGIALSLFTRGLVVEYRVGWESTFLDAAQVHAILRLLLTPAMALFPFQPFSVADIAGLRFDGGNGATAGARWVYIYAALLAVVVIVPRLTLAFYAGWRERQLSSRVELDLTDPYFQRLMALLNPARVRLALLASCEADRQALLRFLRRPGPKPDGENAAVESLPSLIQSDRGDALCLADITSVTEAQTPGEDNARPAGWANRLFVKLPGMRRTAAGTTATNPRQSAIDASDVVLFVLRGSEDLVPASPALPALASAARAGKPVLLLVNAPAGADVERQASVRQRLAGEAATAWLAEAEILGFERFSRCWIQEPVFLDALARCMPAAKKDVFARLADAWMKRNDALFAESMRLAAAQLLAAAREVEEVPSPPPYFKRLTSLNHRQADAQARRDAIAAVAGRLRVSAQASHSQLLRLHDVDEAAQMPIEAPLKAKFDFQAPMNATEAGLAGAATGAASGASIDLVTGGLTLGIATALGAVIGGGAALAGAAWKNRATPAGKTLVQPGDDMLLAMTAAALLRYLAICNSGHDASTGDAWPSTVVMALEPEKETFARLWAQARSQPEQPQIFDALVGELQTIMRSVLANLYLRGNR